MNYPRIVLAGTGSGSGKTLITCGILKAFQKRGMTLVSFKCGPDYIDPMFHKQVLGIQSVNLDTFFLEKNEAVSLFKSKARDSDLSIIEGVMGYYDGMGGTTTWASTYETACTVKAPVILIIDCRGMSMSIGAQIKGFLTFRNNSQIKGIILNRISTGLYNGIKDTLEKETGISILGCVPDLGHFHIESRHLGLKIPGEIKDIEEKLEILSECIEKTVDLDAVYALAAGAVPLENLDQKKITKKLGSAEKKELCIAIARDEAFCFYYQANLEILEQYGASVIEFSPIRDRELPQDADGIILPGGYPEIYAEQLEKNSDMRESLLNALNRGIPCIAECGGFMYLHEKLEGMDKKFYNMAGFIEGSAYKTEKLSRFGYIELSAVSGNVFGGPVEKLRGHEFHYFESENCGKDFVARKPVGKRKWECVHASERIFAGFPHLYFSQDSEFVKAYLRQCSLYAAEKNEMEHI